MKDKIERIHELVLYLNESSYAYYVLDDPKIEDSEYDKLYDELRELENETKYILKNSPTQRVGDVVLDKFEKSVHKARMWSLDKVTSFESLELWHNKNLKASNENNLGSPSYIVVQKFDGVSINLIYENGEFIKIGFSDLNIIRERRNRFVHSILDDMEDAKIGQLQWRYDRDMWTLRLFAQNTFCLANKL